MTPSQVQLYWRAWGAVARAHGWRDAGGQVPVNPAGTWASPALNGLLQTIRQAAASRARQVGGSITAEDLRHACHCIALGVDRSSRRLTNAEFDRVLALFKLLAEPENLDHIIAWNAEDSGARERLLWTVQNAVSPGYAARISLDRFGTSAFEDLPTWQLRQLAITVRQRARSKAATAVPTAK